MFIISIIGLSYHLSYALFVVILFYIALDT